MRAAATRIAASPQKIPAIEALIRTLGGSEGTYQMNSEKEALASVQRANKEKKRGFSKTGKTSNF